MKTKRGRDDRDIQSDAAADGRNEAEDMAGADDAAIRYGYKFHDRSEGANSTKLDGR